MGRQPQSARAAWRMFQGLSALQEGRKPCNGWTSGCQICLLRSSLPPFKVPHLSLELSLGAWCALRLDYRGENEKAVCTADGAGVRIPSEACDRSGPPVPHTEQQHFSCCPGLTKRCVGVVTCVWGSSAGEGGGGTNRLAAAGTVGGRAPQWLGRQRDPIAASAPSV